MGDVFVHLYGGEFCLRKQGGLGGGSFEGS